MKQRDCDHITPDDPALVVDQRGPRDATAKFGRRKQLDRSVAGRSCHGRGTQWLILIPLLVDQLGHALRTSVGEFWEATEEEAGLMPKFRSRYGAENCRAE